MVHRVSSVGRRPFSRFVRRASLAWLIGLACLGAAELAEKGGVAPRGAPGSSRHDHDTIAFWPWRTDSRVPRPQSNWPFWPRRIESRAPRPQSNWLLTVARSVQCATPDHSAFLRAIRSPNSLQPDQPRLTTPVHRAGVTMDYGLWTMDHGLWTMDHGPWTMDHGPWTMDDYFFPIGALGRGGVIRPMFTLGGTRTGAV